MASSMAEQFRVFAEGTADQVRQVLVAVAKREHARIMAEEPRPSGFLRVVDGMRDVPEEAVRPDGRITYHYSRADNVVDYAMQVLIMLSPKLTGLYAASHQVFLNGVAVPNAAGAGPADEIVIANPVPYSRVIEFGKMKMRVPGTDHVYERAARVVAQKFRGIAAVKFTFRSIQGGQIVPYQAVGRHGRTEILRGAGGRVLGSRSLGKVTPEALREHQTRMPALSIRNLF